MRISARKVEIVTGILLGIPISDSNVTRHNRMPGVVSSSIGRPRFDKVMT